MKRSQKNHSQESATRPELLNRVERTQQQLAALLTRQSDKFSVATKKVLLLSFGIVMGGMSLTLLTEPFRSEKVNHYFTIPDHIAPPVIAPSDDGSLTRQQQYQVLTEFMNTLDSLKENDPVTYSEIIKRHETLIDSIKFLIRINN